MFKVNNKNTRKGCVDVECNISLKKHMVALV